MDMENKETSLEIDRIKIQVEPENCSSIIGERGRIHMELRTESRWLIIPCTFQIFHKHKSGKEYNKNQSFQASMCFNYQNRLGQEHSGANEQFQNM